MRILLLAPHPYYQERGTPIAVDLLVSVLAARGDRVDLLVFPGGADRDHGPNVTVHRLASASFARDVPPGFSAKKLFYDARMLPAALRLTRAQRYDVVHAVEEGAFLAQILRRARGLPYVFDMDSSMPGQIVDGHPALKGLLPLMEAVEARAIRRALAVAPMCDALAERARACGAARVTVLRDVSLLDRGPRVEAPDLRATLGVAGPLLLYVGNLEKYQGIELLLRSFAGVCGVRPDAALAIVGGTAQQIAGYRALAEALGVGSQVHFPGARPLAMMGALLAQADVLVSPRTRGANTPMKIYSYLAAGKPILATRLPTHTQVLDPEVAVLAEPNATSFADAMAALLRDEARRAELGARAAARAAREHSFETFRATVEALYGWIERQVRPA